MLYSAL
ncbi:hypothetical protein M0802_015306, partial [Mischocyttarus mexicanus]